MDFQSILYSVEGRVATLTLNRPHRFNAIDRHMPREIAAAVDLADRDPDVHVLLVRGAGPGFCGGYDLVEFAERKGAGGGNQEMPWDPTLDFAGMWRNTQDFMSLWRCRKPTIACVRGSAVAGGSDIALCCDFLIMESTARIGYPPSRVWGVPTPAMWVYRLDPQMAKRMMMTGDLIDGREAARIGLALAAPEPEAFEAEITSLVGRLQGVPRNQLMMTKMVVNQAYENMGLQSTQMMATLFDGVARHTPEGLWFRERAQEVGFKQAVAERDSGDPIASQVSKRR
jgi:enoyl-CoA hydratase